MRKQKRWEVFEYEGQWFVISPSRAASDGPFSQLEAERRAERLNRDLDVRAAFIAQEKA